LGAAAAWGLGSYWGWAGLAAPNRQFFLLFGGRYLYPSVEPFHLGLGLLVILFVSVLSTFYPAYLAAQVQPVMAMRDKE